MSNPARLLFLCAQLIALRVSLATMDDIETRDVLELEVLAANCAFAALWSTTFLRALCPSEATLGLLNLKTHLNGDGERIGRAWAALFHLAKARLGYACAPQTPKKKATSTKPLLAELQLDILRDLNLRLDEAVLNILINPTGDERVNVMIPGGGALTFAAGAELKRAISALVSPWRRAPTLPAHQRPSFRNSEPPPSSCRRQGRVGRFQTPCGHRRR